MNIRIQGTFNGQPVNVTVQTEGMSGAKAATFLADMWIKLCDDTPHVLARLEKSMPTMIAAIRKFTTVMEQT